MTQVRGFNNHLTKTSATSLCLHVILQLEEVTVLVWLLFHSENKCCPIVACSIL